MNTIPERMENFLRTFKMNPVEVTRDEMSQVLSSLKGLRERPILTDVAIGQRVGLSIAQALGTSRARQVIAEAARAGVINREEKESIDVGIGASVFMPPPPGQVPAPLKDIQHFAERSLGFKASRFR